MDIVSIVLVVQLVVFVSSSNAASNSSSDNINGNTTSEMSSTNGITNEGNSKLNNETKKGKESRGLKHLTPGEEFLLSVASFEDTKGTAFESLPHLMKVLQSGRLDLKSNGNNDKKNAKGGITAFPMRIREMMKVMSVMNKADDDEDNIATMKPTSILSKLSEDPMNILLAAIIPFSLLLAAVIPLLFNQLTNGAIFPSITTVATGNGKSSQEGHFAEQFIPILESISHIGSHINKEISSTKTERNSINIIKSILELVTSFINDKLINSFASTVVHRMRSCDGSKCSRKHK